MKKRCQHKNVQQFTDFCLDCGRNIWDIDEAAEAAAEKAEEAKMNRLAAKVVAKLKKEGLVVKKVPVKKR